MTYESPDAGHPGESEQRGFALFPATAAQTRFWREQQAKPGSPALNVAFRLLLSGPVESSKVEAALTYLIQRHEILRTGFIQPDESLKQQVWDEVDFHLAVIDMSRLTAEAARAESERIGKAEAVTPFDLSSNSFIRATWLPKGREDGELQISFHSLIIDGWSFAIFVRELVDVLAALAAGRAPEFSPVDLQYGDYALWNEAFLSSDAIVPSRDYWRNELAGYKRFEMPTVRPRPGTRRHQGEIHSILLPKELTDRVIDLAKSRGLTLFSMAAACLSAALRKVSGQPEIVLGAQMSARDQQELEQIIGPILNTVVLRIDASGDRTLSELATYCASKLNGAMANVHLPFEEMIEMVGAPPDPSRPPLYSVNLALQQSFIGLGEEVRKDNVIAATLPSFNAGALYDLSFFMVGRSEGWRISCEADTDLFERGTVESYLALWREALEAAAFSPDRPISQSLEMRIEGVPAATSGNAWGSGFMSLTELESAARHIVRFNENAPKPPIIALNNTAVFYNLAQQIGADRPFIDIPLIPEGAPRHFPIRAFEDIAADAVRLIRTAQSKGPYNLMGLCVMGAIGFEAAHQLRRAGEKVDLVILNDSWCPGYRETMPPHDRFIRKTQVRAYNIRRDLVMAMRGEISMADFLGQYRIIDATKLLDLAVKLGWLKGVSDYTITENRWYTDYLIAQQVRYRPSFYDGDVQIFRSQQARKGRLFAHELGWKPIVKQGKLIVTEVPTMHAVMFREEGAAVIGKQLRDRLAALESNCT